MSTVVERTFIARTRGGRSHRNSRTFGQAVARRLAVSTMFFRPTGGVPVRRAESIPAGVEASIVALVAILGVAEATRRLADSASR